MLSGPELLPAGGESAVKKLVVFLHGYGSNGDDLIGLAPQLMPHLPGTAFVSPNAPTQVPNTYNGYQWFGIWDVTPWQIDQGLRGVTPSVIDYITAQVKRFKITMADVALIGFSQGTMLSLHIGLRHLPGLAGVIGYAGAMVSPETFMSEKKTPLPPTLLVHGLMDNVVPWGATQMASDIIRQNGGTVETLFRPTLMHSIDNEGIKAGVRSLQSWFKF
ncbi:MAG TPA: phospholipase [Alphaproteobacteria bacterium]